MKYTYMHDLDKSIMIVDDNPQNLDLLENILESAGYDVLAFPQAELALRAAQLNPPVVILLDIMMPYMDGFELCSRLKEDKLLREVPIIFITALNDVESKVKAYTLGGADYITKPFQEAEVLARIRPYVEVRQRQLCIEEQARRLHAHDEVRNLSIHLMTGDMHRALKDIIDNVDKLAADDVFSLRPDLKALLDSIETSSDILMRSLMSIVDTASHEGQEITFEDG